MAKFKTWDADGDDEADAKTITEPTAEHAAIAFAKRNYAADDHPARRTILARNEIGLLFAFEVYAEQSIDFRAESLEVGSHGTPRR